MTPIVKQSTPHRSMLYMPANNLRVLGKAKTTNADVIIYDLEDAVSISDKAIARQNLIEHFNLNPSLRPERVIRINDLSSEWIDEDINCVLSCSPDGVLLPKVNSKNDIQRLAEKIQGSSLNIWAMVETSLAVLNIVEIVSTKYSSTLSGLIIGPNDLLKGTGLESLPARPYLVPWLMQVILAGKAYNIDAIDGVYNDFKDFVGFETECTQAKQMGFDGKSLIHPNQVEITNRLFSPSDVEITDANKIIQAYKQIENKNKNVIQLDGKMVERLHYEQALRLVAKANTFNS